MIDLLSGARSAILGDHPEVRAAAEKALRARSAPAALSDALAQRLAPELSRVSFTSSEETAIDGALKLAFAATRRASVLYCEKSHHGTTLGALSIMGAESLRAPYPAIQGTEMLPFGDRDAAERKLATRKYAAFVVEPIQWEAGVRSAPATYLAELAALCKKHGTLLICDERKTSIGRTGALFVHASLNVAPDIVCHSNALTNGLVPFGAFSTSADWERRTHGRHEEGEVNALAVAVACRVLELVDEDLLTRVRSAGERIERSLKASGIGEVRGKGMLWGIALTPPAKGFARLLSFGLPNAVAGRLYGRWIVERLREKGCATRTAAHDPNVLLVAPQLLSEPEELDRFARALAEIAAEGERFVKFVRDEGTRLVRSFRAPA